MKKAFLLSLIAAIIISIVSATGAVYNISFQLISGGIVAESYDPPEVVTGVFVRDDLSLKKSTIQGNVAVVNGPVNFQTGNCEISGSLTLNPDVYLNDSDNILGGVIRESISFPDIGYNFGQVPQDLPDGGDQNSSSLPVISESIRFNNFNVDSPLTIDTQNGDVFVVVKHLNINADIEVAGSGKATLIAETTFNFNNTELNPSQPSTRMDLIVKSSGLNLQNNSTIQATFYFEGTSINIRNGFNIIGNVFAANASVNITDSHIQGEVLCKSLNMDKSSISM